MMVPTLGRIVWFTPAKGTGYVTDKEGRCAAIVVCVDSAERVNLAVFDAVGKARAETSVPFIQDGEESPEEFFCEWMPYQKEQAAKARAAERALQGGK